MGKRRPKSVPELPDPVNDTNWAKIAGRLYDRGLISWAALAEDTGYAHARPPVGSSTLNRFGAGNPFAPLNYRTKD